MGEGAKRVTTLMLGKGGERNRAPPSTARRLSPSRVAAGVLAMQRERWILWLAPAMVAGAAAWLLAPVDPQWWLGPAAATAGVLGAWGASAWPGLQTSGPGDRLRAIAMGAFALVAAGGLGAAAAHARAASVAQARYQAGDAPVVVRGWVVANERGENGPRLRLLVASLEGAERPPRYVRVAVAEAGVLSAGRGARCLAMLAPPAGPLAPRAYDFARRAYFEQLGATGFALGRCRPEDLAPPPGWLDRLALRLASVRSDLSAAILSAAPGRGGTIAAALVTGDRSSVDPETNEALQNSGLGHLLSVSGIHMGVVGGLVFALSLWSLSLIAPIALRWPVKKIASIAALCVLAAYLVISGASVPAMRSFVMACVAFGAVLIDRPAISMRGLALAAALVTLAFPESVLEPGFQMSFAATMALVALFEVLKRSAAAPALPTPGPLIGAMQSVWRGIGGVLMISAVAGLATDPFALYHFQRFAVYAMPTNLVTAPIMSFLVAPAAAAAALLAPFGWADAPLQVMASALDLVAAIGTTFGQRPEAVRALPQPPDGAFVLCILALLWACLWRGALRWGGVALFIASLALYIAGPRPIAAFDEELRAVYVRVDGRWSLLAARGRSNFARERLGAMVGVSPALSRRLAPPQECGAEVCVWRLREGAIAVFAGPPTCGYEVVISAETFAGGACPGAVVIDAPRLARLGGGLIYQDGSGAFRVIHARTEGVRRAWTPQTLPQVHE